MNSQVSRVTGQLSALVFKIPTFYTYNSTNSALNVGPSLTSHGAPRTLDSTLIIALETVIRQ